MEPLLAGKKGTITPLPNSAARVMPVGQVAAPDAVHVGGSAGVRQFKWLAAVSRSKALLTSTGPRLSTVSV